MHLLLKLQKDFTFTTSISYVKRLKYVYGGQITTKYNLVCFDFCLFFRSNQACLWIKKIEKPLIKGALVVF